MSATAHPLDRIDTQTPRFSAGLSARIHAPLQNYAHHSRSKVPFVKIQNIFKIISDRSKFPGPPTSLESIITLEKNDKSISRSSGAV